MATSIPAHIAQIDQWVGSIEANKYADLFMITSNSSDPYTNLVSASPSDVTLVIVNGVPVYGSTQRITQAGVAATEDIMVCNAKESINSQALTNGAFSAVSGRLSSKLASLNSTLGPVAECQ